MARQWIGIPPARNTGTDLYGCLHLEDTAFEQAPAQFEDSLDLMVDGLARDLREKAWALYEENT